MTNIAEGAPPHSAAPRPPSADREGFCAVRSHTEALAAPLGPEDQVVQSMPDASPTKWHRAHTTWFFEEFVLQPSVPGDRCFDDTFRYLFNSYYEAVGPRQPRPRRGMVTRPDVERVGRYREDVDARMAAALGAGTLDPAALELVELGLHHEQQHQELLLQDVQHLLWQNPLRPAYADSPPAVAPTPRRRRGEAAAAPAGLLEHDGGLAEIGHDDPGRTRFSFDNEGPVHRVWLEPFALEDRLVTCGEWTEFIDDGGYDRPELWLSDGWHLTCEEGRRAPLYWEERDGSWHVFSLRGSRPVEPSEPVAHVTYHEADAFARWRGARLPTEAEWEVVARERPGGAGRDPLQFHGELWQWTASAYLPYPGFTPAPGAVGEYNGKFMVDQHVLRGSSFATPPGHARTTYRNFYPPASSWAYSGVRIAHDR